MTYRIVKTASARLAAVALGLCLLFLVMCLTGSISVLKKDPVTDTKAQTQNDINKLSDDPAAVRNFIESFGWEVLETPVIVKELTVPKSFDAVYTRYNEEIQIKNGYDLRNYAGMQATLYSYEVINYPTEDYVTANVLVHDNTVIGGDICSSRLDGFMHGFSVPDGVTLPSSAQLFD